MSRMSELDRALTEHARIMEDGAAPYFVPPSPKLTGDAAVEALLAQMERKYVRQMTDATHDAAIQTANDAFLRDSLGSAPHVG